MNIEMKGIYKSFGADNVLTNVNFSVSSGEICALLGESGAGKSTLMGILSGVLSADKGEITIDGSPVRFRGPVDALKAGIAVAYQEPGPINNLMVYEYIFLGRETAKCGLLSTNSMISETGRILNEIGTDISPLALMADFTEGKRQAVSICRAFLSGASVIILDEKIQNLSESAAECIFEMINRFKDEGKAIVLVSNSLKHILTYSSRFVIMRDGEVLREYMADQTNPGMIGNLLRKTDNPEIMDRERFVSRYNVMKIKEDNYSFFVNKGEILGLTGSGFRELFMRIMGCGKPYRGKIYLHGKSIRVKSAKDAMKHGIVFAPGNRRKNSIFPDMNTIDNISMSAWRFSAVLGFIRRSMQESSFERQTKPLRIKSGYRYNPISDVSVGSQQKAVLARLLLLTPQVVILDSPAQGMQTEDREDIYGIIYRLAENGVSIIVISDDYCELARVSGRVLVMRDGCLSGELSGSQVSMEAIEEMCVEALF